VHPRIRAWRTTAALCLLAAVALAVPGGAHAALGDQPLGPGYRGADVRALQHLMRDLGVRIAADGVYGASTARKVRRLERAHGWRVDGRVSRTQARRMLALRQGGAAVQAAPAAPAGDRAVLAPDGRTAVAPASAPEPVADAIAAANRLTSKPYHYGGGHARWEDSAYDCSGAVSYALHGAGLLDAPLASGPLMRWQAPGPGTWMTVYAHEGHAYLVVAGLRFDTSGDGEDGPRWRSAPRSSRGFTARHPAGL